jgi:isocitrate dehydrogenase
LARQGDGTPIGLAGDRLEVPSDPVVPFIEGDGTGPDIWRATQSVVDAAVAKVYGGKRRVAWLEVLAGEKAHAQTGEWLPQATVQAIAKYRVAIKGPLTTPVGGGIRSLNVAMRQQLDLYQCIRPVRYFRGVPSPMRSPEKLDVVIFRENTEDVYAGIEWQAGTEANRKVRDFLTKEMGADIREGSGIGIKPVSEFGSKRLIRRAIEYAIAYGRPSVTIIHKGNIQKYTEGAFRDWGYALARDEFPGQVVSEKDLWDKHAGKMPEGKVLLNDRIADNAFQQLLTRPDEYSVLATTNLNGDYLSDAAAAQVGGLGIAPGGNVGDGVALFEATHGTAPKYAGQDKVNPGSLLLSACMMLRHLGWREAADAIEAAFEATIVERIVTYDFARQLDPPVEPVKTSEFARAIADRL